MKSRSSNLLTFTFGVLIILGISLVAFYLAMRPPMSDLGLMIRFLSITALISTRQWFRRLPVGLDVPFAQHPLDDFRRVRALHPS